MPIDREFLTKQRQKQLALTPRLCEAERWQKYCYIPLDIPRIENPQLVDWFFEKATPVIKKVADFSTSGVGISAYKSVDIFPNGYSSNMVDSAIWTLNIQQEFMTLFADVYKQIMDEFPFTSLNKITLWSSQQAIGWHRDDARVTDCPNEFRVLLYDENASSTINVAKALPDQDITNVYKAPRLPNTNSFAWNNLRTKHSTDYETGNRKIIMVFSRLDIDVDRYHDLMKRSEAKYQDVAMIDNAPTSDWVDL